MSKIVQFEIDQNNRWIYFSRYRWIAHVIYWIWVFIAGTLLEVKVPITPRVVLNHFLLENLLIAIFYYTYCLYLIPYYFKRNKNLLFWALTISTYLLITALDTWFVPQFVTFYTDNPILHESSFWARYSYNLGGFLLNFMVFSMMLFFMEKNEEGHRFLEFENEKKEIEQVKLNLLKTNISPDFLMRSLRQIKTAASQDDEHTPQSILTFSDLLRYRLYWGRQQSTPLEEEIQALSSFIQFLTLQHTQHNLEVTLILTGSAEGRKIAPLSLINILELFCKVQPVVPTKLDVNILIYTEQLEVALIYRDPAPESLISDLKDYARDYQQLFGNQVSFNLENCDHNPCSITLRLPLS